MSKFGLIAVLGLAIGCRAQGPLPFDAPPPAPPPRMAQLLGEYGTAAQHYIVFERDRKLILHSARNDLVLVPRAEDKFGAENESQSLPVSFVRDDSGRVVSMNF